MEIVIDELREPEVIAFLEGHVRELQTVTPPESQHVLDLDGLRHPDVTFWSVHDGGTIVGTGALKRLDDGHGEIKSMRTAPTHRRQGVGSLVLATIEDEARGCKLERLSLETGSFAFFEPARRFYLHNGYELCAPFGDHHADPNLAFLTKALS
jgi:putative acetyltransferase